MVSVAERWMREALVEMEGNSVRFHMDPVIDATMEAEPGSL